MGSGKSCVGKELSSLLGSPFVDLDEYIVEKAGRSIVEIFDAGGEEGFRALEGEALAEILRTPGSDLVLSLGGGTVLRKANSELIAQKCKCVFLRASAQTLRGRLSREMESRPMLRSGSLETLLSKRTPIYERAADLVIDTDGLSVEQVAREIANVDKWSGGRNHYGTDLYKAISAGIKASNTEAFEVLFKAEFENVRFFISRYVHHSAEAEDLAQETFSALWNSREYLKESLSIKSYLFTIARNKSLNYLKALRTRMTEKLDIEEVNLSLEALSDGYIVSKIDAMDMQRIIDIAMEQLPQTTREIFLLNREEGLTYDEIASRLGLSVKQVEYNIVKALKHFRRKLSYL